MLDFSKAKNVKKGINRVLKAISLKQRIILFGDGDLDGVASVVILKQGLEQLGCPPVSVAFANREKYGYGLSEKALKALVSEPSDLLIVMDCGTNNLKGISMAKKIGLDVIVIDHHRALEKLPKDLIIINPKQEDDKYEFKELCGAGLCYEFLKTLFSAKGKLFKSEQFLELAMLATLFDMVSLTGRNKEILEQGIISLSMTERKGLQALIEISGIPFFERQKVFENIVLPLASANLENEKNQAFVLLTETSLAKAKRIAYSLAQKSRNKRDSVHKIVSRIKENTDLSLPIIFEGHEDWPLIFAGSSASQVCRYFDKPSFIFHKGRTESQGSVRTPKNIDAVELMRPCAKILVNYGGHPQAAGFGLKTSNLEKFKKCLVKNMDIKDKL